MTQTGLGPGSWGDLFEASAGASAALTGLMFVALSLNVREILQRGGISERAAAAVLELLGMTVASLLVLTPQSSIALGIELTVTGAALCSCNLSLIAFSVSRRASGEPMHLLSALMCTTAGPFCLTISGASLCSGFGGGLYWTVAGIGLTLFGGVMAAWILLVEILR